MDRISDNAAHLTTICSLFSAVNKSCREMKNITYTSGDPGNDHVLTPFQTFLCKLAQICDTRKGGDTITAMVALKDVNRPAYLFASNKLKDMELEHTKKFLSNLLDFVGNNPNGLAERALQKKVLWRILEFNFPRVDYYLKQILTVNGECIDKCLRFNAPTADVIQHLRNIETKAKFPRDMKSGNNAKDKFLRDCEILIRAIQSARLNGLSDAINEYAGVGESDDAKSWCELRHYLGRLHSYRQAAECIVKASQEWPELFTGFTICHIPSSHSKRLSLPKPALSSLGVIQAALLDMDLDEYSSHIDELRRHNLDRYIQEEFNQKSVKQLVHCEVHLQDFLVREGRTETSHYWNGSMFIATSKPPCRLCHYYFSDLDSDFQVQSSHMNVYPRWRLPDLHDGQEEEAIVRQNDLLEDIIEQMQQDILRIVKEKLPQGKRNDSRTDSRGLSTANGYAYEERSDARRFRPVSSMKGEQEQSESDWERASEILMTSSQHNFVDVGAAL